MSRVISFSYKDANQMVVLPTKLAGKQVRLAQIKDMMVRIYCVDAGTGQGAMWPDELDDTGCDCRAVPIYCEDTLITS